MAAIIIPKELAPDLKTAMVGWGERERSTRGLWFVAIFGRDKGSTAVRNTQL